MLIEIKNRQSTLFVILLIFILSPNTLGAQVTIGSVLKPNRGALLDLKQEGITTKGLGLPRVTLKDTDKLTIGENVIPNEGTTWSQHAGLLVYNVNRCFEKGGDGVYVWDGSIWQRLPKREMYDDALYQPNSYWVLPGTTSITIPIEKAFRIWEYYGSSEGKNRLPSEMVEGELTPVLYWQDAPIILSQSALSISGNSRSDIIIVALAGGTVEGNAVVALQDGSGAIRWSWHIWVTDDPTIDTNLNGGGFTWMDRNLGATSAIAGEVGTIGLAYQWGRKDPFPLPKVWSSTEPTLQKDHGEIATAVNRDLTNENTSQINFKNSIAFPLSFIKKVTSSSDWYNPTTSLDERWDERWDRAEGGCFHKSPFDPCPAGWRVPSHKYDEAEKAKWDTSPWQEIIDKQVEENGLVTNSRNWKKFGVHPISGYRTQSGGITSTTTYGYLWSASAEALEANTGDLKAYTFYYSKSIGQQSRLGSTFGFSVRCVKE